MTGGPERPVAPPKSPLSAPVAAVAAACGRPWYRQPKARIATATKTSAQIAHRSARSSTTLRRYAPRGTVTVAATHSSPVRRRSITRRAGGTNGPASANSSSSATGTATAGQYSAASEGERMSAEPKPENPRTTPARSAASIAAANVAERTSRLAPPAWTTAAHRRTPGGSADEPRLERDAALAPPGGGGAAALRRLADEQVLHVALDVGGAGGGEVVVQVRRVHACHGELRRAFVYRANGATCGARPLSCVRGPLSCAPGARRVPRRRGSRSEGARRRGAFPTLSAPPRSPRRGCVPPPRRGRRRRPAAGDGAAPSAASTSCPRPAPPRGRSRRRRGVRSGRRSRVAASPRSFPA